MGVAAAAGTFALATWFVVDEPWQELSPQALRIVAEVTSDEPTRFASHAELDAYLERIEIAARIQHASEPPPERVMLDLEEAPAAAPAAGGEESITNIQEAGVDEGGIVKAHGDHLVVLRRGRLYSVRLREDGGLEPVSRIDAYPEGTQGGWYDEMLIHGDTIVVIGFNYGSGGTELARFRIDGEGRLSRIGTHYLRSDDYYSSRNYASRLVGGQLLIYTPYTLLRPRWEDGSFELEVEYPGTRPREQQEWDRILEADQIVRPIQRTADPVLHTVVACDLEAPQLRCRARGVLGPRGRSFYVSRDAVYIWVGADRWGLASDPDAPAVLYRLPLDDAERVGAIRVRGMPIDQLGFREADGYLNVLVRDAAGGDPMWNPEASAGQLAVLGVPLGRFEDGLTTAPRDAYVPLPGGSGYALHDRFVGEHLLYGHERSWRTTEDADTRAVFVHPLGEGETTRLELPHEVQRIEVMGRRAVVVGSDDDAGLHFTGIDLGERPRIAGTHVREGAAQGERRTHGFFYKPMDADSGTLGLPIRHSSEGRWAQYRYGSAGVLFLEVDDGERLAFTSLGSLDASGHVTEDHCVASCTDWYGNARPIFYRGRIYALLGYELVEGRIADGAIAPVVRANLYEDLGRHVAPDSGPDAIDAGVQLVPDGGVVGAP